MFVFELVEGMTIGKDVYNDKGIMIIPLGAVVTEILIARLESLEVETVYVEDKVEPVIILPNKEIKFKEHQEKYITLKEKLSKIFDEVANQQPETGEINQLISDSFQYFEYNEMGLDIITMLHSMKDHSDVTYTHCINVGLIASFIGRWLGWSKEEIRILNSCGLFHDIGKLLIPKEILDKTTKLSKEEEQIIQNHTVLGYHLLKNIGMDERISKTALMHHERCDGTGYPLYVKDAKISDYAKIIAIADVYEAMTTKRAYRNPLCPFEAIEQMESIGFQKFDTKYLLVFIDNIVNTYLNAEVMLSDGSQGEIVLINNTMKSRPLVMREDGQAVDLTKDVHMKITTVL